MRTPEAMPVLTGRLLFCLAAAVGVAVANLYYTQPMLGLIASSLEVPELVGLLPTFTQAGYAAGLLLLVPLGDTLDRRRLVLTQCWVLLAAIVACALAPGFAALCAASVLVGACATIAQQLVPLAADLAPPQRRARAIAVVFIGSLFGILLARAVSGVLTQAFGWRAMFWSAAGLTLATVLMLGAVLPKLPARSTIAYPRLLASLWSAFVRYPPLRKACAIQACVFGASCALWAVLALRLQAPPFELGPAVAGAFGLIGILGVAAVTVRAKSLERHGPWPWGPFGAGCCAAGFVVGAVVPGLTGLVAAVILLDVGLALSQVSGQSLVLGLDEAARSRINTLFITASFVGGATGSAGATFAWQQGGWLAVCGLGFGLAVAAVLIQALYLPERARTAAATGGVDGS